MRIDISELGELMQIDFMGIGKPGKCIQCMRINFGKSIWVCANIAHFISKLHMLCSSRSLGIWLRLWTPKRSPKRRLCTPLLSWNNFYNIDSCSRPRKIVCEKRRSFEWNERRSLRRTRRNRERRRRKRPGKILLIVFVRIDNVKEIWLYSV